MDRQLGRDWTFCRATATGYILGGKTKEPVCPSLWVQCCMHFVFPLCHQHWHDGWLIPRHRDPITIFQLWGIFPMGIYNSIVCFVETGRTQKSGPTTRIGS